MLISLFALLLSCYLYFTPDAYTWSFNSNFVSVTMIAVASGGLLGIPLFFIGAYYPLLKSEEKLTPRLLNLFSQDRHIRLYTLCLALFAILSYILGMLNFSKSPIDQKFVFCLWILFLGISIDITQKLTRKLFAYLNPFDVVDMMTEQGIANIREKKDRELFQCVEGLTEIGIKSVNNLSSSLSIHVTDSIEKIVQVFMSSAKSLSHYDAETQNIEGVDKVSYGLYYVLQRIEMLYKKALESGNEPLCNHIIKVMGKLIGHAAEYDITLATDPLHYIGKFVKSALNKGFDDVGEMTSCTLEEVAKFIVNEIDLTYLEIRDLYVGIINYLEDIAKQLFKHNKNISVQLLMLPFENLRKLFSQDKIKNHQDTPVILQNIRRVLTEFETLQTILKSMPPISKREDEPPQE